MEKLLRRKVDEDLVKWKNDPSKKPLIVNGARQIGKTSSILKFAYENYKSVVHINFIDREEYKTIFQDGFVIDKILRNISFYNPHFKYIPGNTLFFFDEMQACPSCATSLKFFSIDGRFDVICSGSLMGLNYHDVESVSVGYKQDYKMHSMDFEEFLWAKGYNAEIIEDLYEHIRDVKPLGQVQMNVMYDLFREYMVIGGMPAVVKKFIDQKHHNGILDMQRQLLTDNAADITKYAIGLDKAKVKTVYENIPVFLAKESKRYQMSKIAHNARNRDYVGCVYWLNDAGIINICYCLDVPELPLKGNYDPKLYKIYYRDTGLLIASLDDDAQNDLRLNKNFGTYKGAIYENIVGDMLVKQGYNLFYYAKDKPALEIDFFVRDMRSLIPVEVKAKDNPSRSLRKMVEDNEAYPDVRYGIKFGYQNIGFDGQILTLPYFLAFLLKRFLTECGIAAPRDFLADAQKGIS